MSDGLGCICMATPSSTPLSCPVMSGPVVPSRALVLDRPSVPSLLLPFFPDIIVWDYYSVLCSVLLSDLLPWNPNQTPLASPPPLIARSPPDPYGSFYTRARSYRPARQVLLLSWAILLCHGRLLLTQYMQFLVRGIVQSSLSHLALTSFLPPSPSVPTHPHPLFPDSASLYNLVAILSPLLSALSV